MISKSIWRYIPPLNLSGKVQMAIDIWLLTQHQQGKHPSVLRFYTWSDATISYGYHQHQLPDYWQQLTWQDQPLNLVRRPTGGKAVLHQGDLSYMIVTSAIPGKRLEVYKAICEFLIQGWRSLGINLYYGTAGSEYIKNSNCFATATPADLVTISGDKPIGSAQLRKRAAILQHGSMLLSINKQLFSQVFQQLPPRSLNSLLTSSDLEIDKIINTLKEAAICSFDIDLIEQPFSNAEWQDIFALSRSVTY